MMMAVQNSVTARDIGVATSSATFFRATGGTIGTAVFLSLLFNGLASNVTSRLTAAYSTPEFLAGLQSSGLSQQQFIAKVSGLSENSSFINELPASVARPIQQGFVDSTHVVYVLAGIVAVIAFGLVLMLKEVPLRTKSALQEMQEEQNAEAAAANAAINSASGAELEREIEDAENEELVGAGAGVDGSVARHGVGRHGSPEVAPPKTTLTKGKHAAW